LASFYAFCFSSLNILADFATRPLISFKFLISSILVEIFLAIALITGLLFGTYESLERI
jgi:hypothetical protein